MTTVNLEAVTGGKLAITLELSLDPRWTSQRFKSTKLAADLALDIARKRALLYFSGVVLTPLLNAFARFHQINGDRPKIPSVIQDEWDSGLDDEIYAVFEDFAHLVSQNWLGTVSDITPHSEDDIHKLTMSFAHECWQQAVYQRTTNQTLSAVGIVVDDLQAFVLAQAGLEPEKPMSLNAIFNKIILNFVEENELEALLDNASDTDAGLQASGAAGLGITLDEAAQLAAVRAEGGSVIEGWMHMINTGILLPVDDAPAPSAPVPPPPQSHPLELPASLVRSPLAVPPPPPLSGPASGAVGTVPPPPPQHGGGTVPPPPPPVNALPVTTTGAPPAAKGGRKGKAPEGPPAGAVPAPALVAIKAASGLKDEDFAVKLGVSRPTFNNYLRGKGFCVPTPDQRAQMLSLVDTKIAELQEARKSLT